jgi:hypothetical protein
MRPISKTDGHDGPRLIDEFVPSIATVVEYIVVGEDLRLESQLSRTSCAAEEGRTAARFPGGSHSSVRPTTRSLASRQRRKMPSNSVAWDSAGPITDVIIRKIGNTAPPRRIPLQIIWPSPLAIGGETADRSPGHSVRAARPDRRVTAVQSSAETQDARCRCSVRKAASEAHKPSPG